MGKEFLEMQDQFCFSLPEIVDRLSKTAGGVAVPKEKVTASLREIENRNAPGALKLGELISSDQFTEEGQTANVTAELVPLLAVLQSRFVGQNLMAGQNLQIPRSVRRAARDLSISLWGSEGASFLTAADKEVLKNPLILQRLQQVFYVKQTESSIKSTATAIKELSSAAYCLSQFIVVDGVNLKIRAERIVGTEIVRLKQEIPPEWNGQPNIRRFNEWNALEDCCAKNVTDAEIQDDLRVSGETLPSDENLRRRKINKTKFKIAGERAREKLTKQQIAREISALGDIDDINKTLLIVLTQRKEVKDIIFRLSSQETMELIEKLVKIVGIVENVPREERSDMPTSVEMKNFIERIIIATIAPLPLLYPPKGDIARQSVYLIRGLMEQWGANPVEIANLSKVEEEIRDAISKQNNGQLKLTTSMFACLFCQVARLANDDPREKARYVTLNPLRSDFLTVLPYLVVLQRLFTERLKVQVVIDPLIIGDTDDRESFGASLQLQKEMFSGDVVNLAVARQRLVAEKISQIASVLGIPARPVLYSEIAGEKISSRFSEDFKEKRNLEVIQQRKKQWLAMIEEVSRLDRKFKDLMEKNQVDFSVCAEAFTAMYFQQGEDLSVLRKNGSFLLETIGEGGATIYTLSNKGLDYPSTNIFPQDKGEGIFALLQQS